MAKDMTTGSPVKHILQFFFPILLGNIFQQLYNMADTIIVGKYISTKALAAVGTTGPLMFLTLGFVIGITSGFSVITAQCFGANDKKGLRQSAGNSMTLALIITVILTALSLLFTEPLLNIMNTPSDIYQDSKTYISIIFIGIGCTMLYNMVACILRALGDSKTPLYFLVFSSILNIVLDLVFIINFKMGVAGAAYATIISQGVSGILCLFYANRRYPILRLAKEDFYLTLSSVKKHLGIGIPMALQFSITSIGVIIMQSALNLFGSTSIAAFAAATKVEQLVTQPAVTFGTAIATYAGQNKGANKPKRIQKGVRVTVLISFICSLIASAIVVIFGKWFTSLFLSGSQPEVIKIAQHYLNLIAIFFPFLNMIFIFRNALQGMGKSFIPLLAGVTELIMRAIVAFTLPQLLGYTGVFLASPIAWVGACVTLIPPYIIIMRKLLKEDANIPPVGV